MFLHIFSTVLLPIVLVAGAGYVLGRHGRLDPSPLARVTFYLFNPCLVFTALANSSVTPDLLGRLALLKLLTYVLMVPLTRGLAARASLPATASSAFVLATAFANSGNYGMSVNEYAFGADGLALAALCYVTDNLMLNSLGVFIAARGRASAWQSLAQVLRNPALYAVPLGIILQQTGWSLPLPLARALELSGRAAVPTMQVVLGMQLAALPLDPRHWRLIGIATSLRLIVSPLIALALASLLGLTGLTRQVGVLQSAVPTAVMASIIASRYNTEPNLVAGAVLVSSLTSLLTVTALLSWLH